MANQAIALQARAPQTDFMGRAIQQNAQMMNMMSQQRAAERQAAQAAQAMEIARAAEGRAVTKAELDARKANQEFLVTEIVRLRNRGVAVGDDAGYQMWLSQVEKVSPEDAAAYRQYSPTYDPDKMKNIIMEADKFIDKTIATPVASFQIGGDLKTYSATVGGTQPGVTPLMVRGAPDAAAVDAPSAPPAVGGANARPTQGTATAPADLRAQGVDPRSIPSGNPLRPISMTDGAQPDLTAVVQDMMQSGKISQANLQLMRDAAGPDKDAQLAQILKANNIQIVPDAQPQMRSAVFRPGEDAAPQMQLAQATNAPGTQFRVAKDPMQSPTPGSAQVPLPRVRAEAEAKRETPAEAAAKAAAVARAKAAAAAEAKRKEKLPERRNVSLIIGKMREAYEMLNRMEAIPSEKRGAVANFFDYLGATSGGREYQKMIGKDTSKYFSQIQTLRKQLATAIKNATGMSAQEMNSNVELRLTLDAMSDPTQGFEAAMQILQDTEELYGAPAAAPAKKGAAQRTRSGATVVDW